MNETKPFYRTSEFWATVGLVATTLAGAWTGSTQIKGYIITASIVAYALSRGLAKSGVPASSAVGLTARRISVDEGALDSQMAADLFAGVPEADPAAIEPDVGDQESASAHGRPES